MASPTRILLIALLGVGLGCVAELRPVPVEVIEPVASLSSSSEPPVHAQTKAACDTPLACAQIVAAWIDEPDRRAEVEREIGEAHAASEATEAALEIAEQRLRDHPHHRIELLAAIATRLLAAGDRERMQQVLAIARSEADAFDRQPAASMSSYRRRLGGLPELRLANKHLELGQLDEAAALAEETDWRDRVALQLAIAARRPDAQGRVAGLELAEAAVSFDEPLQLVEVARGYLAAQRPDRALPLLRRALAEARVLARSDFGPDADDGCAALGGVAAAHAEPELLAARGAAPRRPTRGSGLGEAMRLARNIDDPRCLDPLVERLTELGATTALARLIEARPGLQRDVHAHAALALASRRTGDHPREARSLTTMMRTLEREPELRYRVDAIEALARRYLDAGYVTEARALLDQAAPIARRLDPDDRDTALGQLAAAQAAAGQCAVGVTLAREADDPSYTLAQVAEQCTQPAELPTILDALPLVRWPDRRAELLAALAGHFARSGALRRALELTAQIDDPAARARALVAIQASSTPSSNREHAPLLHATVGSRPR